jgi:hypothetical protein
MSQDWTITFPDYCSKLGADSISIKEKTILITKNQTIVRTLYYSKSITVLPSLVELFIMKGDEGRAFYVYENGHEGKDWLWYYDLQDIHRLL